MLGSIESPYKSASDSPSRQLLWELGQLQLRDQQNFYEQLDKDAEEREALLRSALETAALEHEKIRKSAEVEREKLELQLQLEKELRRQEELKELERVRREKAERELEAQKQKIEEARAAEAAEREADAKRAAHAAAVEQARAEREKRDAEYARQAAEREEANRKAAEAEAKAREAAIAAAKARDEAAKVPTPAIAPVQKQIVQPARPSSPITTPVRVHGDREAEHRRYLEIHQKLKQLRKFMANCAKQDANLKKVMGDSRRTIRKCVGQLTGEKSNNREPVSPTIKRFQTTVYKSVDARDRDFVEKLASLYPTTSTHHRLSLLTSQGPTRSQRPSAPLVPPKHRRQIPNIPIHRRIQRLPPIRRRNRRNRQLRLRPDRVPLGP